MAALLAELPPEIQRLRALRGGGARVQTAVHARECLRAVNVMRLAVQNGACAIRLFADVDADSGLTALEGCYRSARRYQRWMTIAGGRLSQDGFAACRNDAPDAKPWTAAPTWWAAFPGSNGRRRSSAYVSACFDLAQQYDRDLPLRVRRRGRSVITASGGAGRSSPVGIRAR
ncbi:MAG: hypothetical protein R2856_32435 [Caldilineaceae bacterium]